MKEQDYHKSIIIDTTPHEAFNCICSVAKWWTENLEGGSQKLNDEFSVRFGDVHYSKQKLVEFIPDKKVVWLVTDSNLNFLDTKDEWTNTKIVFEVLTENNRTQVHFTHLGLVPRAECYENCVKGWDQYLDGSLFKLLVEGKGKPALKAAYTH